MEILIEISSVIIKLLTPILSFFKSNIFSMKIVGNRRNLINFVQNVDRREMFLFTSASLFSFVQQINVIDAINLTSILANQPVNQHCVTLQRALCN